MPVERRLYLRSSVSKTRFCVAFVVVFVYANLKFADTPILRLRSAQRVGPAYAERSTIFYFGIAKIKNYQS